MLPLSYNWRCLFARKQSMLLTFIVLTTLVFVLAVLLSFVTGLREAVAASGAADNLVVLAPGATAESTSLLLPAEVAKLTQVEGIRLNESGEPLISREIYVQTTITRHGDEGALAHVGVRGLDDIGFQVHRSVRIIEGRGFQAGTREVIVGRAAAARYAGLDIGRDIALGRLGNRLFTVVGVFEAGGSALENEIWAVRTLLADAYERHLISSVHLNVSPKHQAAEVIARIAGPAVSLSGRTEEDYYAELLIKTREVVSLATFLVVVMSLGAVFAVANTMFAAVDGRKREVAMLRTLGFGRFAVGFSFVTEAFLVCAAAAVVGLIGSAVTSGAPRDFLSDSSWTAIAYERRMSPMICLIALGVSCLVGMLGALVPAMRAARMNPTTALRRI